MAEPVTTLTDLFLALLAGFGAWSLRQSGPRIERSRRLWAWGLGVQGAAAFFGGVYHGFLPHFGSALAGFLWHVILILLATAGTLWVSGLGLAVLSPRGARVWLLAMGTKLLAYIVWVWPRTDFFPALCDQALALVLLVGLLVLKGHRVRVLIPNIAVGLCAIVLGGLIQYFRFGLHHHFNHNDLYHLFGALTIWCFYRAGRGLRDFDSVPKL